MRNKASNTFHAYFRAAERCGWGKKKAKQMMLAASKHGWSAACLKPGKLRDFVMARQVGTPRRIKFYKGYLFVFASTSTRCYTVYPVELEKEKRDEKEES